MKKTQKQTKQISDETQKAISMIHHSFMQPQKDSTGRAARKNYWIQTWSHIKQLSPGELEELSSGMKTTLSTLNKLLLKIDALRTQKLKEIAESHRLVDSNEWEEDDFLDSTASLPVFKPKQNTESKGRRWVMATPIERPKTTAQICQAVWIIITNRAIHMIDGGKDSQNIKPSLSRDTNVEKHRLAVIPAILDDKTIADVISGKPLMNLYSINEEVKETLLWLLAKRAKANARFRKLFMKFLKKEIIKKKLLFDWARKYTPQAQQMLKELETY